MKAKRTKTVNVVSEEHIQFSYRDTDVIRIDAERRLCASGQLLQSLAVCTLQRHGLEQNHHHQVEPPNFVRLTQTVDPPHLPFLVGIGNYALRRRRASRLNAPYEAIAAVLRDILAQLRQQTHRPLLANFDRLTLQTQHV